MFIPNQEHLNKHLRRERPKRVLKKTRLRLEKIAENGGMCQICGITDVRPLCTIDTGNDEWCILCRNCSWIESHPDIPDVVNSPR